MTVLQMFNSILLIIAACVMIIYSIRVTRKQPDSEKPTNQVAMTRGMWWIVAMIAAVAPIPVGGQSVALALVPFVLIF